MGEHGTLALLALALLQQPPLLAFQLLDARALDPGFALRLCHGLGMGLPSLLPRGQRGLAALQCLCSAKLLAVRRVEPGHHGRKFLRQRLELASIALQD